MLYLKDIYIYNLMLNVDNSIKQMVNFHLQKADHTFGALDVERRKAMQKKLPENPSKKPSFRDRLAEMMTQLPPVKYTGPLPRLPSRSAGI